MSLHVAISQYLQNTTNLDDVGSCLKVLFYCYTRKKLFLKKMHFHLKGFVPVDML